MDGGRVGPFSGRPGNASRCVRVARDRRGDGDQDRRPLWREEHPITAFAVPGDPAPESGAGTTYHDTLATHLAGYRARIDQLEGAIAELAAEPASMDSPDEEDAGDADGSNVERDRLVALVATARRGLDDVKAAMARLAAGTYGICARCGERIPDARLEAVPEATHCVACKTGGLRLLGRR